VKKRRGASFYGIALVLTGILERLSAKGPGTPCAEAHPEPVPVCPIRRIPRKSRVVKGAKT